jgi:hydroxypyruvate reductase
VAAADPLEILPPHLPAPPKAGRTLVLGAGKAAASMALAVERGWPEDAPLEGVALTRYGHGLPTRRIRVVEAGHPLPDAAGELAAREKLAAARALGPEDLLLALLSGGGSALLSLPAEGVSMRDLTAATRELLRCGAPIQEINTVRKHLSAILGGQLAAATRARVLALVISDVTGDDPTHIASGPCAPDPTTYGDALGVLNRYSIEPPPAVRKRLEDGARGALAETPKPGDPLFARVENRVIATAHRSLEAAARVLREAGVEPRILGDSITGEAREVAREMASEVRRLRASGPGREGSGSGRPLALISGGECTVTVKSQHGRGGRCAEFLLALGVELAGAKDVWAIAADTDGIDGSEDNAGALLAPDSLARARAKGLDAARLLDANDSWGFFSAIGDLLVTGPTRTNVNDFRCILVQ